MTSDLVTSQVESILNASPSYGSSQQSEARISQALSHYKVKNPAYNHFINYYEGIHDLRFATEKWRNAFGNLFRQFADNLCPAIVDAAADRMQITGFDVPDNDELSKTLWNLWTDARMDRKAGSIHEHAFKVGDAYIIVWPDASGHVQFSPNPGHQICVSYDDSGETIEWATKLWMLPDKRWRINIYDPLKIEKWVTKQPQSSMPNKATSFSRYFSFEPWPIPNVYGRVPVFHFANNAEMGVWANQSLQTLYRSKTP